MDMFKIKDTNKRKPRVIHLYIYKPYRNIKSNENVINCTIEIRRCLTNQKHPHSIDLPKSERVGMLNMLKKSCKAINGKKTLLLNAYGFPVNTRRYSDINSTLLERYGRQMDVRITFVA